MLYTNGSQSVVLDQLVLIVLHVILIHIKVSEPLLCTMGIINNNNKYELCFDKGDPYFPKNLEAIMDLADYFQEIILNNQSGNSINLRSITSNRFNMLLNCFSCFHQNDYFFKVIYLCFYVLYFTVLFIFNLQKYKLFDNTGKQMFPKYILHKLPLREKSPD